MRLLSIILSLFTIYSTPFASAATDTNSFEKSFQNLGKKLDQAKAKGQEVGQDAKEEWQELKAKTEKVTTVAKEETKEARDDWSQRLNGAFTEFGAGIRNAWSKLKGEK